MRSHTSAPEDYQYQDVCLNSGQRGEKLTLVSFIQAGDFSILKPKGNTFHSRFTAVLMQGYVL